MKRFPAFFCAAFVFLLPGYAYPQESQTRSMSFDDCLKTIRNVSSQLGVAPVNVVETDILRIVRFPTSDGSVLVTCSRPDRKMVLTKTDN